MLSQDAGITIVPFTPGYTAQVIDLIVPIQREEFAIPITAADQPDLQDIAQFYQQNQGNFWIALHRDIVVGTIALLDIGAGQGALRKMFVNKEYRGPTYAVARQLLDTLLDWTRANDFAEIFLGTTAKFLAAHRFYEKHGFQEISAAELPEQFPIMPVDTKFYRYTLR